MAGRPGPAPRAARHCRIASGHPARAGAVTSSPAAISSTSPRSSRVVRRGGHARSPQDRRGPWARRQLVPSGAAASVVPAATAPNQCQLADPRAPDDPRPGVRGEPGRREDCVPADERGVRRGHAAREQPTGQAPVHRGRRARVGVGRLVVERGLDHLGESGVESRDLLMVVRRKVQRLIPVPADRAVRLRGRQVPPLGVAAAARAPARPPNAPRRGDLLLDRRPQVGERRCCGRRWAPRSAPLAGASGSAPSRRRRGRGGSGAAARAALRCRRCGTSRQRPCISSSGAGLRRTGANSSAGSRSAPAASRGITDQREEVQPR